MIICLIYEYIHYVNCEKIACLVNPQTNVHFKRSLRFIIPVNVLPDSLVMVLKSQAFTNFEISTHACKFPFQSIVMHHSTADYTDRQAV